MLKEILRNNVGESNAVKIKELMFMLGLNRREVNLLKENEVLKQRALIGSCHKGYYIISNLAELNKSQAFFKSRIKKESRIIRALGRNFDKLTQQELEV